MRKAFVPILATFVFFLATACMLAQNEGDDVRKLDRFSEIGIAVHADVFYSSGNTHEVRIEGDTRDVADLITKVEDGFLKIKYDDWRIKRSKLTIYITSEELEGVKVSGSGHFTVEEAIGTEEMDLGMSGSGSMDFRKLEAEEVDVKISGSGRISIESGQAEEMDVKVSGSGKLNAESFSVSELSTAISGSGSIRVTCTEELEARISGSGSVYYHGSPRIDSRTSGSGKVKSL